MQCLSHQNPKLSEPPLGLDAELQGLAWLGAALVPPHRQCLSLGCTALTQVQ